MTAFLISIGVVALAEIGDKTQLLALALAAKYRKPWPIILGIFFATLANHFLAGAVGTWLTRALGPDVMRWALGLSFVAMAAWMLVPDKLDEGAERATRFGVFGTTLIAFFLVEMGDKTQIATVALAARYDALVAVVAGTTIGMLVLDGAPPRTAGGDDTGGLMETLAGIVAPLLSSPYGNFSKVSTAWWRISVLLMARAIRAKRPRNLVISLISRVALIGALGSCTAALICPWGLGSRFPIRVLIRTLWRLGKTAEAEAAYRRALELEQAQGLDDASIYNTSVGYFLYRHGRSPEALPLLEKAVKIDPTHQKAAVNQQAVRAETH